MKLLTRFKLLITVALGLTVFALTSPAQLIGNLREQATFGPFVGGINNSVSNNGSFNTQEVIKTGVPLATPFRITYNPNVGPFVANLATDTLETANLVFHSPITPLNYFSSLGAVINYDFDNDGTIDLTENYTISLSPFTSPNGFTGVAYSIAPTSLFGSVTINGVNYSYASVVANSAGTLFDGSSTKALLQFQFSAVPEPSTYGLVGATILGGAVWLRRTRRPALKSAA